MAAPNWKEYDFSKSGEEIIRDLVTNHAFRKDQGVDVIRELIAQARACQTKSCCLLPAKDSGKG